MLINVSGHASQTEALIMTDKPANKPANKLVIAAGQLNPTVGDIYGNVAKASAAHARATEQNADMLLLTELFIAGYPPEDLVLETDFQRACRAAVESLTNLTIDNGTAILIGTPWLENGNLYNSYCLLDNGVIQAVRHKMILPNYGPFDEKRLFCSGPLPEPVYFRGIRIGLPICEDIWSPDVVAYLARTGAELIISPNGSPFWIDKQEERRRVVATRVSESGLPFLYINQVGGQDELVFDGGSFALQADGRPAFQMPAFEESLTVTVWERGQGGWLCRGDSKEDGAATRTDMTIATEGKGGHPPTAAPAAALPAKNEAIYMACVLSLRDYVNKNGFPNVVIGLSGGLDSALCAAMAVDALGAHRVHCIMLPYRFTSDTSLKEAAACAQALGVRYDVIPINDAVESFDRILCPISGDSQTENTNQTDSTGENIQARTRGLILMAVCNKFGSMLVATSNKSELSVGYATLYGDMNGGYNPVKDLYKTRIFALARWRNSPLPNHCHRNIYGPPCTVIPENIITRAPSAELRERQKDDDTLPPYSKMDIILHGLLEDRASVHDLITHGHDATIVKWVEKQLRKTEYKRRQSAPGAKISKHHFGRDRRYPLTSKFYSGQVS